MRPVDDLQSNALNFWPKELAESEKSSSIIPLLLETQDKFISLLHISDASPEAWRTTLQSTNTLQANLFLKHLLILSDIGGEKLQRFKTTLPYIFPDNNMEFSWNGENYEYYFKTLSQSKTWSNKTLTVDGENLIESQNLNDMMEDVIMLVLFGGSSIQENLPEEIIEKCIVGSMLGQKDELELFVKQRYILVSKITSGATANTMGQLAQSFVANFLKNKLTDWNFDQKSIPGISQNDGRTPIGFDIVAVSPTEKYCAIEVSFQVTTNSTIERKAGQARSRRNLLHRNGHKIVYIIDGAGNFERKSAINTISKYSDLIVTFGRNELNTLVEYLVYLEKN